MKKSCSYCGKLHEKGFECPKRPKFAPKRFNEADDFRSSGEWKNLREYIKRRDNYLCRACFCGLPGTISRLNTYDLSVHHIIPVRLAPELKSEPRNLITLCRFHHEMAEKGAVSADRLRLILPPEG